MASVKRTLPAWLLCALLFGVTLFLYWPVRHFDFVNYDDPIYVIDNRHVQSGLNWEGVQWAFTSKEATNWHPLTWLSHMLDVQWFGMHPGPHHVTSVVLHSLNAVLLFLVWLRMTKILWPSFLVAALFAWHPLRVESVVWIAERKDVLSMLFFLLTLYAYVLYAGAAHRPDASPGETNPRKNTIWRSSFFYLLTLALFALGLMCKPMLVTMPFLLLVLDYWPLKRLTLASGMERDLARANGESWRRLFGEKIPLFALSAASCMATFLAQSSGGAVATLERTPLDERLANAVVAYVVYLKQMVWPVRLAVFYPYLHGWGWFTVLGCAVLLFGITAVALWQRTRRQYLLAGWLWYLGTLVPVIGIVQVGDQAHADRYTYLPLIGIAVILAWSLRELLDRRSGLRTVVGIGCASALTACLFATRHQLQSWRDAETLFRHALAVTENNYVAHNSLGNTLTDQKRLDEAKKEYDAALSISPLYSDSHINLGRVFMQQGDLERAIEHFHTALEIKPASMLANYNLGVALGEQGRNQEAVDVYQKAVALDPDFADAHYNLALALAKLGRPAEAEAEDRKALRLSPRFAYAHYSLAITLQQLHRDTEACEEFQRAVQFDPQYMPARYELGSALLALSRFQEAVPVFEEILRLQPTNSVAQNNLGLALARLGKPDVAVPHFAEVVRLEPESFSARYNLANALMAGEQYAAAATNFAEALRLKPGDTKVIARLVLCRLRATSSGKEKFP